MKILMDLLDHDIIETESFLWNPLAEDESAPNFWWKPTNIQVEWYRDDPGRGMFSNYEEMSADDVVSLLLAVREDYDLFRDRE